MHTSYENVRKAFLQYFRNQLLSTIVHDSIVIRTNVLDYPGPRFVDISDKEVHNAFLLRLEQNVYIRSSIEPFRSLLRTSLGLESDLRTFHE